MDMQHDGGGRDDGDVMMMMASGDNDGPQGDRRVQRTDGGGGESAMQVDEQGGGFQAPPLDESMPPQRVTMHGIPVLVPLERRDEFMKRLGRPRSADERTRPFRVMSMDEVAYGLHYNPSVGKGKDRVAEMEDAADDDDKDETHLTSEEETQRKAFQNLRRVAYASCKNRLIPMAYAEIGNSLPGLDQNQAEAIVDRTVSQLSAWSIYGELPPDLKSLSLAGIPETPLLPSEDGPASQANGTSQVPALLRGRRERDAVQLLKAKSGRLAGPVPANNTALRDAQVPVSSTATTAKRGKAARDLVAVLARALTGTDKRGQPKHATRILMQARDLAAGDGVLLVRNLSDDPSAPQIGQAILVRADEAARLVSDQQARHLEHNTKSLKEGGSAPLEAALKTVTSTAETKKLLQRWTKARDREDEQIGKDGLRHRDLEGDVLEEYSKPHAMGDLGSQCRNRLAYYRSENIDQQTQSLPPRTCLPISRAMMDVFVHMHRAKFDTTAAWRLAPDAVMPTCPMIQLLIQGPLAYHMSAHALLEQYTALIVFASDRLSPPGVRPPVLPEKDAYIRDSEMIPAGGQKTPSMIAAEIRAVHLFSPFRVAEQAWQGLPDWCGRWFLPQAFLPRPQDPATFEIMYPTNDPTWHPWIRQVMGTVIRKGHMRGAMELTDTALLDAFGMLCTKMEQQLMREKRAARQQTTDGMEEDEGSSSSKDQPMDDMSWVAKYHRGRKERMQVIKEPDRSRAGRAETLMGLVAMPSYYALLRKAAMTQDEDIDRIRVRYGPGVNCGNGFCNVRPAAYYDELWDASIKYLTTLLEIHELIILLLHSRWLDAHKARDHMMPAAYRLDRRYVEHATGTVVRNTMDHRKKTLNERLAVDGRVGHLMRGPERWSDANGRFTERPAEESGGGAGAWVHQPVKGQECTGRPDAPPYLQMILFDHLIEYTPMKHEAKVGAEKARDEDIMNLIHRTGRMEVHSAKQAELDPTGAARNHQLPFDTLADNPDDGSVSSVPKKHHRDGAASRAAVPLPSPGNGQGASKRARPSQDETMRD